MPNWYINKWTKNNAKMCFEPHTFCFFFLNENKLQKDPKRTTIHTLMSFLSTSYGKIWLLREESRKADFSEQLLDLRTH